MKILHQIHFIIILFLAVSANLKAQEGMNLVPNPSFEDTIQCPIWVGDFTVADWIKPTYGSSDYFHTCSTGQLGIPQNVFGWQHPRTGNAYVGAHGSGLTGGNAREYIQCQLITPLEAGKQYEVSFWITRADSCTIACNNIGAYLSESPVYSSDSYPLPYIPQVISQDIITDAVNWVQIIDTITAEGGEEYLTIGVFSDDNNTDWIPVAGGWHGVFHYFYDDVSVIQIPTTDIIDIFENDNLKLFPNPSNKEISITSMEIIKSIDIYSYLGHYITTIDVNSKNRLIDLTMYSQGLYLFKINTNELTYVKKIIINH